MGTDAAPECPSINGHFVRYSNFAKASPEQAVLCSNFNPRNTQSIQVVTMTATLSVKILACLPSSPEGYAETSDLEQTASFMGGQRENR